MFDAGGDSDDEAVDCKLEFFLINPDFETANFFPKFFKFLTLTLRSAMNE